MKELKRFFSLLLIAAMLVGILPAAAFAATNTFISNGSSDYSILLPNNASEELQFAAGELNAFLNEIEGVMLPIVSDANGASASGKWISIGNTTLFSASGNSTSGLKAEASVVKTYNNSILLYGGSEVGATYAVYDLLGILFSLTFYTPDFYTYTANATVTLGTLNQTRTPAVDYRSNGRYLTWFTDKQAQRRMRSSMFDDYMDNLGHSYYSLLPPSQYYSTHPEWYSNYDPATSNPQADWQLCLSNSSMRTQLIANVKAKLAADRANGRTYQYFAVGQNDGGGFCTCSSCRSLNLQYSTSATSYSGAQLALLNEIADACSSEYPDVIFYMLAYTQYSDQAPTRNITAHSNVGVMLAPIDAQTTYSYFGNSGTSAYNNGRVSNNITQWNNVCSHLMMWGYGAQFGDALCPMNTFDSLSGNASGYNQYGFEVVFEQGNPTVLPYFETMKNYLECKAFYDGSINTATEIANFISAYYGAASSAMSDYYNAFIANIRSFEAKGFRYKSFVAGQYLNGPDYYSPMLSTSNYTKSYVDQCKGYFDTAYAALANAYGAGTETYNTYKKHVDLEYFGVLLQYLRLYRSQLTAAQGAEMTRQIIEIIVENQITAISTSEIQTWIDAFNITPEGIDFYFFEPTDSGAPCTFAPFTGTVGNQSFSGVKVTSNAYQPHFRLTAKGAQYVQSIAQEENYDTVRIHAYAILYDNAFVMNNAHYIGSGYWTTFDVNAEDLTQSFDFWSQSQGNSEVYLWFEFLHSAPVTAASFSGSGCTFSDVSTCVVSVASNAYQPKFYFTAAGVQKAKDYATENSYDTLRITATYSGTNCLVLNNAAWIGNGETKSLEIPISDLSTAFEFWSQSESATAITMTFEFLTHQHSYTAVVTAPTCTAQGYTTYTCTCGDSYIDNYVAALGHNFVYTDNANDATHTVTCSRCDYSVTEAHNYVNGVCICGATPVPLKILSASLKLDEDIDLIYTVSAPSNRSSIYMVFEYMGSSFRVDNYTTNAQGKLCFAFERLAPQCMGQSITATVYAKVGDTLLTDTVADYSVKTYCSNQLTNYPNDATLVTLLSDLLTYGAFAQLYTGFDRTHLVTTGMALSASNTPLPTNLSVSYTGTADPALDWESAALGLSNNLALRLTFKANDTSGLTLRVAVNGREQSFGAQEFESLGNDTYSIFFRGISATEFGETVTASFLRNNAQTGRTLHYSVNTYICNFQSDSTVPYLAQLLRALYRYGHSAEAYAAAH